jgi:L-seryl-tRNA(Ser) seleniumtransferase
MNERKRRTEREPPTRAATSTKREGVPLADASARPAAPGSLWSSQGATTSPPTENVRESDNSEDPATRGGSHDALRALPSVGALLGHPSIQLLIQEFGHSAVAHAVRNAITEARRELQQQRRATVSEQDVLRHLRRETEGSLRAVLNATGVIIHTNLGRAPLARQAIDAIVQIAGGYATLEYNLEAGHRGDRASHAVDLLVALSGAEDAIVVNNNAAALLLALSVWASGREVIVSRGELVEIGGGFRIPDVLVQSGARLVEVGTTNRTRLHDYRSALRPETALLLKVHRSNFDMIGFASEVCIADLARLARERGLPLFYDAGSGNLLQGLLHPAEAPISVHLHAGADLVMFSGDKLLGGPQAGILVGHKRLLAPMRRHPLMRALRPDKLCLAALRATLLLLRDAPDEVPVVRMLRLPVSQLEERANRVAQGIRNAGHDDVRVVRTDARVGGGAAPSRKLESRAVRLGVRDADRLRRALRAGAPPVVARVRDSAVLIDLRCIPEDMDLSLTRAILVALAA